METFADLPILLFESQSTWRQWLHTHHEQKTGAWLKIAKKTLGKQSVSYLEALDDALCYGWIDARKQSYDEAYFLQKFCPRRSKSMWSKVNVAKADALIALKKMQPAGLTAIEAAKKSGSWQAAYDSPSMNSVPEDFKVALDKNFEAKRFFETLNKTNVYAFCWRIQTAKRSETRIARIEKFIAMLGKGEKLH
jgi:uncharacterized protein YdeI (YjbR/CyaY-like superfamily)